MLHQIVFSGNVMHLNEVLALQASNPEFRLLCKTLDDKTVREVASERAHAHPQMMRRIEQCISLQPDIVNEKPPYRRFYLAHHLAYVGELDIFKDLSTVCHFKLDLLAENKTISQIAREHNHIAFAEYIESLHTTSNETTDDNSTETTPSHATGTTHYSQGFYHDPGMSFIPPNLNMTTLFLPTNDAVSYPGNHHSSNDDHGYATHSLYHGQHLTTNAHSNVTQEEVHNDGQDKKSVQPKSDAPPPMTDAEQAEYEKTVISNIQKMSQNNLLNSITCCITKAILHDPGNRLI
jgi:hypothetical protein